MREEIREKRYAERTAREEVAQKRMMEWNAYLEERREIVSKYTFVKKYKVYKLDSICILNEYIHVEVDTGKHADTVEECVEYIKEKIFENEFHVSGDEYVIKEVWLAEESK